MPILPGKKLVGSVYVEISSTVFSVLVGAIGVGAAVPVLIAFLIAPVVLGLAIGVYGGYVESKKSVQRSGGCCHNTVGQVEEQALEAVTNNTINTNPLSSASSAEIRVSAPGVDLKKTNSSNLTKDNSSLKSTSRTSLSLSQEEETEGEDPFRISPLISQSSASSLQT